MRRSRRNQQSSVVDLFVKTCPIKGRCLHTRNIIGKGQNFLTYEGKLCYQEPEGDDTFIFEFPFKGKTYWIDATIEDDTFGRLVNDSENPNCKVKVCSNDGIPSLIFHSLKEIGSGEEILYNYGPGPYPWRMKRRERDPVGKDEKTAEIQKVFVASGNRSMKDKLNVFADIFGGKCQKTFNDKVTHVIVQTVSPRICERSLKYLQGIAHHCWVLDHQFIEDSLKAGYLMSEENYEILGDTVYPNAPGPVLSRKRKTKLFLHMNIKLVGQVDDFPKEAAEDIIITQGANLREEDAIIVSINERGERETIMRDWIFDCLSTYRIIDRKDYCAVEQRIESHDVFSFESQIGPDKFCQESGGLRKYQSRKIRDSYKDDLFPIMEHRTCEIDDVYQLPDTTDNYLLQSYTDVDDDDDYMYQPSSETDDDKEYQSSGHDDYMYQPSSETDDDKEYQSSGHDDDYQPPSETDDNDYVDDQLLSSDFDVTGDSDDDYDPSTLTDNNENNLKEGNENTLEESLSSKSNNNKSNTKCHPPLSIDGEELFVSTSAKSAKGDRIWNKKHQWFYCEGLYSKLARHMQQVHKSEIDVARALVFPVGSKERKEIWRKLTNKGDYIHNMTAIKSGIGEIIPYKRPKVETKATEYMPCANCFGSFLRKDLWRHVKNCQNPQDKLSQKGRTRHQAASAALLPVAKSVSKKFREDILDTLANDEISLIIRGDQDIINFGERKYMKCAANPHQYQYVRQKLRELARFLHQARKIDQSVKSIRDLINPLKFHMCVEAVKHICEFDENTLKYKIPSLALKLGHSLHKMAKKLSTDGRKHGDGVLTETADGFIKVYVEDWETEISSAALETQHYNKYNKAKCIPVATDIQLLSQYLQQSADSFLASEKNGEINEREWRGLCEVTLAQIVLFNKRRAGEAERMTLEQYNKGLMQGKTMQEEVLLSLSPFEKKLAESIARIEVRGKCGRRVLVLLPEKLKNQLKLLMENRNNAGINTTNDFVFARSGDTKTPLRSTDVLRKFSVECGAKQPQLLTTTSFRKHIAVISQMINLKENELDTLAGFLGHNIKVHRDFYRLPEDTLQVAKISKILLEMEKGKIHLYKGKTLDEIQFDPEELMIDEVIEEKESLGVDDSDVTLDKELCEENGEKVDEGSHENKRSMRKVKNKITSKKSWTVEECDAVNRQLGKFLLMDKLPGKKDILDVQKKEPLLSLRPWSQIKFYIKNKKVSQKRKMPSP